MRNNFACLWRLLANAFEAIAQLPLSMAYVQVPGALANVQETLVTISGDTLFELASR